MSVNPRNMLNNFRFNVEAQMSHFTCHSSLVIYIKCLCLSLGHAEQFLLSCGSSKIIFGRGVTFRMSHVIYQMVMLILGTCLCYVIWYFLKYSIKIIFNPPQACRD